jgi:uncharacterized flavoprotein (TIGR03862 family)
LRPAIEAFPPQALRDWAEGLGQATFVGSSGRVFPEAFKASPLLRAWLRRLDGLGVRFQLRHGWTGWDTTNALRMTSSNGAQTSNAGATILALGGASWPRLGSDGGWRELLSAKGISVMAFQPANCGFRVAWSDIFRQKFEGQPLKTVALSAGEQTSRGEMVVTKTGIEGGGVYALSASLRDAFVRNGEAVLNVDLRPDLSHADLTSRLSLGKGKQSAATFLRKAAGLSPIAIGLLQEDVARSGTKLVELPPDLLSRKIKTLPIMIAGLSSMERAISSAGGVAFDEINDDFMLRQMPGVFVAGEMLDWEAPTGGYLLQACFATGVAAGRGALKFIG